MTNQEDNDLNALVNKFKAIASPFRSFLNNLHLKYEPLGDGQVADYIPELSQANSDWFGICVVTVDGQIYEAGECNQLFTIQSISHPFVYGLALEDGDRERTLMTVGVEPTKETSPWIIQMDDSSKRPPNPLVNAGAVAATSLVKGVDAPERLNRILDMFRRYVGHDVSVDKSAFASARTTRHLRHDSGETLSLDTIDNSLKETLDLYFQQCSLKVSCKDIALMAATLANNGINPITGEQAVDAQYVKDILSVMHTSGISDKAGEWAYKVGVPAKSSLSGGLIAVALQQAGIGVFSPPLDEGGNSVRGLKVCEELSERFGLHAFDLGSGRAKLLESMSRRTSTL